MLKRTKRMTTALLCLAFSSATALAGAPVNDQLPDPDGKPADMTKPVKVFIIMGQSNTLEFGQVGGSKDSSLESAVKQGLYPFIVDDEGNWTTRSDVRQVHVMQGKGGMRMQRNDWLGVKKKIGIDLGIGHQLGTYFDEPVLVLRSSIGNRGLGWDLLPPGSPSWDHVSYVAVEKIAKVGKKTKKNQKMFKHFEIFTDHDVEGKTLKELYDAQFEIVKHPEDGTDVYKMIYTYAGYGERPSSRFKGSPAWTEPGWYAGKQYDDDVRNAKAVLSELATYYPGATEYEVAGFFWWQGCKDRGNPAYFNRYEKHLSMLVDSLRKDFDAPNAKFVAASLGEDEKGANNGGGKILEAIFNLADAEKYPKYKGTVAGVYSHPLTVPKGGSCGHYGGSAKTYMNVGLGMGETMVNLFRDAK